MNLGGFALAEKENTLFYGIIPVGATAVNQFIA